MTPHRAHQQSKDTTLSPSSASAFGGIATLPPKKPRKLEMRSFDLLKQLDREVIDEKTEVVSSETTKRVTTAP